jgi:hypothetical protein
MTIITKKHIMRIFFSLFEVFEQKTGYHKDSNSLSLLTLVIMSYGILPHFLLFQPCMGL